MTMSLHFTHLFKVGELGGGLRRVPSTKSNFLLVDKAIVTARFHEPNPVPSKTDDTISKPG